jgi:glutathione S-transferase
MYDVHYWPTPNGKKMTIPLEELGVQCKAVPCNIGRGGQFTPEFLKMKPKSPRAGTGGSRPGGGGEPIVVFESGAISIRSPYPGRVAGRVVWRPDTNWRTARTEAWLAFAVLTTERKAA